MNVCYNNESFDIDIDGSPFRSSQTITSDDGVLVIDANYRDGIYKVTIKTNKYNILERFCKHMIYSYIAMVLFGFVMVNSYVLNKVAIQQ